MIPAGNSRVKENPAPLQATELPRVGLEILGSIAAQGSELKEGLTPFAIHEHHPVGYLPIRSLRILPLALCMAMLAYVLESSPLLPGAT